jgi:hypothetical protein
MTDDKAFRGRKWIGGLSLYSLTLLVLAYAAASAERGVAFPWMLFFAPLTAASRWVSWDGPVVPMIVMFFGVALEWPLAGAVLCLVPMARRRRVARAGLLLHYLSGIALAGSSLNRFQRAALVRRPVVLLVSLSVLAYVVGQVAIWRAIRKLQDGRK